MAISDVLVGTAEIRVGVGSNSRTIGYTVDGVTATHKAEMADIKVEELDGTIIRRQVDAGLDIAFTMAEATLENMVEAIPGSALNGGGNELTLGGEELQEIRLTLIGVEPSAGRDRIIVLYKANPTGEVGLLFKKGELTPVPVTFSGLIDDDGMYGETIDGGSIPPTVVGAATTSVTNIRVEFSKNMNDPVGKHIEFWYTEDTVVKQFTAVALWSNKYFDFTCPTITGTTLKLFYRIGTIISANAGILQDIVAQTITIT